MPPVTLNEWFRDFPDHTVGGSLYAVPPPHRVEAAALLTRSACRVHADIILGPEGHRGVGWEDLATIRSIVPDARVDLHLILLEIPASAEESVFLETAAALGVEAVTMAGSVISRQRDRITKLRQDGIRVFEELAPATTAPQHRPAHEADPPDPLLPDVIIDGALVMFIQPGTQQSVDLAQLNKVSTLSSGLSVAVDGGITRDIAHRCHQRGASYLVSGRDLFNIGEPASSPSRPRHHHLIERRSA